MRKLLLLLLFWPFAAHAELKFDIHRFTESETMQMRQFTEPGIEWRLAQFVAPGMLSVMPVPSSTPPAPCSGTNYYVSNSGNNSNNGTSTSTPWQTIAKVNTGPSGLFQGGNCINFNGGQTFTGNLTLASGGNVGTITPANPIVVQSYGTGRATLQATTGGGDEDAAVRITDINSFTFRNLIVRPGSSPPRWCVDINGASGGVVTGIDVGGCTALTLAVGHYSVDILIRSSNAVTVSNNTVSGIAGVTSKDDTGINADGMSAAYTIIGNTILNIGGRTGADGGANGTSGNGITTNNNGNSLGTVSFNLIHDTGANTNNCGGPSGILAYNMGNLTVSSNEVYNIRPLNNTYPGSGCDWDGIDLDGGVLNSIVEYNYTHNNGGAGLLAFMGPVDNNWGPNTYRYNISENDLTLSQLNGFFGAVTFSNEGGALPLLRFYNNTIYNSLNAPNNSAISITSATPAVASGSIIANNMIITTGNNKILSCNLGNFANITFRNNGYYTSGGTFSMGSGCGGSTSTSLAAWMTASGETGATIANPVLFAGVPAGTCTWTPSALSGPQPCPTAYQPLAASYLSTGVNLTAAPFSLNVGTRDYYGNTIPNGSGTGYNIGAYGGGTACERLFFDDFSAGYTTNWNIGFPWEAGVNVYSPTYVQANPNVSPGMNAFATSGSGLTIGAKLTNGDPDAQGRIWYTGLLASKFTRIFGYYEYVSAMPLSPGAVNGANWLYPVAASNNAEIDVIEHQANFVMQTVWDGSGTNPTHDTTLANVTTLHTYGVDWQTDFITFYIDGTQTFQTPTPANSKTVPMQMVLSVNIGNPAGDGTTIPQFMTVKSVGAYVNKAARNACGP